ncbi:SDR family NAD(P)-dependent oxidoreductase, partial [Achromobacter animicus]
MDLQLAGKRVLITGASKGIGLACAIAFAREGAEPVLVARDDAALHDATAAIREQTGRQAGAVTLDLAQPGAAERLCKETGPVDILVNNAGAVPGGALDQVQDERWRAGWELKVHGYISLARHYYPAMRDAGSGVIAN